MCLTIAIKNRNELFPHVKIIAVVDEHIILEEFGLINAFGLQGFPILPIKVDEVYNWYERWDR